MTSLHNLTAYLDEIARIPVLTPEAQLLHCRRIQTWLHHPDGRTEAPRAVVRAGRRSMDAMVTTNLRLVVSVAKKYSERGLDVLDLIQEGSIGLMLGLERFDPTRGYALSTYCYWWIRQSIVRALHTQSRTIRLPVNTHEKLSHMLRFSSEFHSTHKRPPTNVELAAELGVSESRVANILSTYAETQTSSLDHLRGSLGVSPESGTRFESDWSSLVNILSNPTETSSNSPEAALAAQEQQDLLEEARDILTPEELRVLEGLYFQDQLMTTLAVELNRSRSGIYTIRNRALKKLQSRVKGIDRT